MLTKKQTKDIGLVNNTRIKAQQQNLKLVINYAFDVLKLEEISAYVFPDNNPSIRVLEKNRFGKTGEVNEYHPLSQRCRNSLIYTIKNKNYTFH